MIGQKGLALLIASAALYVTSCEKSFTPSSLQSCSYDAQCPSSQLCIDSMCVGSCGKDTDCPEPLVCEQEYCVPSPGSQPYSPEVSPKTPEETVQEFTRALQENNLEGAVSLFSDHVQDRYRTILGQKQLPDLARELSGGNFSLTNQANGSSHSFQEGNITIGGDSYPITFYCHDDTCRINSF